MIIGKRPKNLYKDRFDKNLSIFMAELKKSPLFGYVNAVYLYGSFARDEQKYDSDIDVLVLLDDKIPECEKKGIVLFKGGPVSEIKSPELDVHFYVGNTINDNNSTYFGNIKKDGRRIWPN